MVLAFGARQSTRDVDVVILLPREARIVRELAAQVADEYGWAPDWLNDGAKGYLRGISEGSVLFSAPGIEVRGPSLEQLLAMKLSAWRDEVDISDARRILQEIARTPNHKKFGRQLNLISFPEMNSRRNMRFLIYGSPCMELIEQFAEAAISQDHLRLRSLVQDLIRSKTDISELSAPRSSDARVRATSASIAELLAMRQNQQPPAWTKNVGALKEPFYLLRSATQMKRLRELCETQSPEPMRKRKLYAPPHFLEFA